MLRTLSAGPPFPPPPLDDPSPPAPRIDPETLIVRLYTVPASICAAGPLVSTDPHVPVIFTVFLMFLFRLPFQCIPVPAGPY